MRNSLGARPARNHQPRKSGYFGEVARRTLPGLAREAEPLGNPFQGESARCSGETQLDAIVQHNNRVLANHSAATACPPKPPPRLRRCLLLIRGSARVRPARVRPARVRPARVRPAPARSAVLDLPGLDPARPPRAQSPRAQSPRAQSPRARSAHAPGRWPRNSSRGLRSSVVTSVTASGRKPASARRASQT